MPLQPPLATTTVEPMAHDDDTAGILITDNVRERRFEVDHNFDGWRLDLFLQNRIGGISRTLAATIAKEGDVEVIPARKVKAGTQLRLGDLVIVREHLAPEVVQDDQVDVIHHDHALLVVNKPAGMLIHQTATVHLNTLQGFLERQGFAGAEPAHRIDRETSGLVVCAAAPAWVDPLRRLFREAEPEKVYRALALDPPDATGRVRWPVGARDTLRTPLGSDPDSRLELRMGRGDQPATTHVEVLGRCDHPFGQLADLRVTIETGRQHQIRVHLAMEGTPLAGDKLYGKTDQFFMDVCDHPDDPDLLAQLAFDRHALHAWRLSLPHPATGVRMAFEAPLPAELW